MTSSERNLLRAIVAALPAGDAQETGRRRADQILAALASRQGTTAVTEACSLAELFLNEYLLERGDPLTEQAKASFDQRLVRVLQLMGADPAALTGDVRAAVQRIKGDLSDAYRQRNRTYGHGERITAEEAHEGRQVALNVVRALAFLAGLRPASAVATFPGETVRVEIDLLLDQGYQSERGAKAFLASDDLWLADEDEQIEFGRVVARHVFDNSGVVTRFYVRHLLDGLRPPPLAYLAAVHSALGDPPHGCPQDRITRAADLRTAIEHHTALRLR